jgi:hypothetical protein
VGQGQEQRGLVQEFVCAVQSHFRPRAQTLTPVGGKARYVDKTVQVRHAWAPHARATPPGRPNIRCGG